MKIAAFIPSESRVRLGRVLWKDHALVAVESAEALSIVAAARGCQLFVVDPQGMREDVFGAMLRAIKRSGVSLVLWTPLTPTSCARTLQASTTLAATVLLSGVDDDDDALRAIVRIGGDATAAARLLYRLAERIKLLPADVAAVCTSSLIGGKIPMSVEAFAERTSWSARTLHRQFVASHLGHPSRFAKIARLVRTWEAVQRRADSLSHVAKKHNYVSEKSLSSHYARFLGAPLSQVVRSLSSDSFVDRLVRTFPSYRSLSRSVDDIDVLA